MNLLFKKKKSYKKDLEILRDDFDKKINSLEIKLENIIISRILNNADCFKNNSSKRVQLLMRAKEKGFFDNNNHFTPFNWGGDGVFKHNSSNILYNYGYDEKNDTLRIPATGDKGNGRVIIYQNGVFCPIYKTKQK